MLHIYVDKLTFSFDEHAFLRTRCGFVLDIAYTLKPPGGFILLENDAGDQ